LLYAPFSLHDALPIWARVEEIGSRLCNHCYTSPITVAASLHWLATCRDAFIFEDCVDDSPMRHELTQGKLQAKDGWITVPDGPRSEEHTSELQSPDHI